MKVQNVSNLDTKLKSVHNLEVTEDLASKETVFRRQLSESSAEKQRAYLAFLSKEIDEQGQRLFSRADIKELEKYRSLIREFVGHVVNNGYSFDKENTFESRGRHRVFALVKKIDANLDSLAKDVLSSQEDNLAILHKIDDIRGLLLDLML